MSDVKITLLEDGPIRVDGACGLEDHDGNPLTVREGKAIFLCRCGGSAKKPFCDGSHKGAEFDGSLAVED